MWPKLKNFKVNLIALYNLNVSKVELPYAELFYKFYILKLSASNYFCGWQKFYELNSFSVIWIVFPLNRCIWVWEFDCALIPYPTVTLLFLSIFEWFTFPFLLIIIISEVLLLCWRKRLAELLFVALERLPPENGFCFKFPWLFSWFILTDWSNYACIRLLSVSDCNGLKTCWPDYPFADAEY